MTSLAECLQVLNTEDPSDLICAQMLYYAITRSDFECIEMLVMRGVDVNATYILASGNMLQTACSVYASSFDSMLKKRQMINFLLSNKADIESRDDHGFTPLMRCVSSLNHPCIELLLEKKADTNARSIAGRDVFSLIDGYNPTDGEVRRCRKLLQDAVNKRNRPRPTVKRVKKRR